MVADCNEVECMNLNNGTYFIAFKFFYYVNFLCISHLSAVTYSVVQTAPGTCYSDP